MNALLTVSDAGSPRQTVFLKSDPAAKVAETPLTAPLLLSHLFIDPTLQAQVANVVAQGRSDLLVEIAHEVEDVVFDLLCEQGVVDARSGANGGTPQVLRCPQAKCPACG